MTTKLDKNFIKLVEALKKEGKKIGFCCGAYDLLHPGHMNHLEQAKKMCDVLIVAVTCDKWVKERKGSGRPVYSEKQRAYTVSQLKPVDYTFICPFKTAIETISMLRPHFYIRGTDYKNKKENNFIKEKKAIESFGGEAAYTKYIRPSTTEVINEIQRRFKK